MSTLYTRSGKRVLDLLLASAALVVLSPLLAVVALLVRWRLGRPVLFHQSRVGLDNRIFTIAKFRTMLDDGTNSVASDPVRLTPFGRWLRRTSLDELPELMNIVRGDMSLVGPRPLLVQYLPRYSAEQARRHHVRPGLTGWAQVNGRNAVTWEQKFQLDVFYVDHISMVLDIKIIVMTIWQVLTARGVNEAGQASMSEFRG